LVEGAAGFADVFMGAEGALALKAGEDAERLGALADATGEGDIDFAEAEHLQGLNETRISGGTGGADGVMRTGDAHIDGDLAGRVVRDGARIVMMRPIAGIVVELRDVVDLVLRLHVAVLGGADVD